MPKVPYPYEVNGKFVTGNGSLIPICSLSNRSFLPSLTVVILAFYNLFWFLNENPFRSDQSKRQISWKKNAGFVNSGFVKNMWWICDKIFVGGADDFKLYKYNYETGVEIGM